MHHAFIQAVAIRPATAPICAYTARMAHLTRHDHGLVLDAIRTLEERVGEPGAFARACVQVLAGCVACEACEACTLETASQAASAGPHAIQVALGGSPAVFIVLRRRRNAFTARERARVDLLAPHLAFLWRVAHGAAPLAPIATTAARVPQERADVPAGLTRRESEVMRWLACGKTDADIAALLAISPRTVHKHLEHIYDKLGVETRTAAVMRMGRPPD